MQVEVAQELLTALPVAATPHWAHSTLHACRQELPAVKAGRVVIVDGNQMFNRPVSACRVAPGSGLQVVGTDFTINRMPTPLPIVAPVRRGLAVCHPSTLACVRT